MWDDAISTNCTMLSRKGSAGWIAYFNFLKLYFNYITKRLLEEVYKLACWMW